MNKEETKKAIDVMQAYVMGKTIEVRSGGAHGEWTKLTLQPPSWNWQECEYRIAPEPMEIEVWTHPNVDQLYKVGMTLSTEGAFLEKGWTKRKFREVL